MTRGRNKTGQQKYLIVGGDSQIGKALSEYWTKNNIAHHSTTRRSNLVSHSRPLLDLGSTKPEIQNPSEYNAVVICAAKTSIAECEENPSETYRINVEATFAVAKVLSDAGAKVIYLSTSAVFDGSKPNYTVSDEPNPRNAYGKQKQAAESLIKSLPNHCVIRLTKVVHPEMPLLTKWRESLDVGKPIQAFTNITISPLAIESVIYAIDDLILSDAQGLFHLSGEKEIATSDFAKLWADKNGYSQKLIQSIPSNNANEVPKFNSLKHELGVFPSHSMRPVIRGQTSYSFEGQDLILLSLLRNVSVGNYVEVGANLPIHNNNTFLFYTLGWHGIAIDGNDAFCTEWSRHRPRDKFICAVISDSETEQLFYKFSDHTVSTIDDVTLNRYLTKFDEPTSIEKIYTKKLNTILSKENFPRKFEILLIDAEGADLSVLKSLDLTDYRPKIILIETKMFNFAKPNENAIFTFLRSEGYAIVAKTPLDAFFVDTDCDELKWIPREMLY